MKENTEGKLKQTHHTMRRVKEKNRRRTPEKQNKQQEGDNTKEKQTRYDTTFFFVHVWFD